MNWKIDKILVDKTLYNGNLKCNAQTVPDFYGEY